MSSIYVPYKDKTLDELKYRLYSVIMDRRNEIITWNLLHADPRPPKMIDDKFYNLQRYFIDHNYSNHRGDFELEMLHPQDNEHKYVKVLNKDTTSVFLGIFIKAILEITEREFKEDWGFVCITGDLEYKNETLKLVPVDKINDKYENGFKGEAEKIDKECLFLYVSDPTDKDVPEEGKGQGKNGKITVKHFSPEDAIDDIFDYLFGGHFLPVREKVNLNISNVAKLKKYIAKHYLEDGRYIGLVESSDVIYFDEYQSLDYFEGFVSASLCLLRLFEAIFKYDKTAKDNPDCSSSLLMLMGAFNKTQLNTSVDYNTPSEFDNEFVFELDILDEAPTELIVNFCPPRQSKLFYSAWNLFCISFLREYNSYSPVEIKFKIFDFINFCLDEYEKIYHEENHVFWTMVNCFLICEFKLEGYKEIEKELGSLFPVKNYGSWKEHVTSGINYDDNTAKMIGNILDCYDDKMSGLEVAGTLLFGLIGEK